MIRALVLTAAVALTFIGCTSFPRSGLHRTAAISAFRSLVSEYNALPAQFDDPVGRQYCLGFSTGVRARVRVVPPAILAALNDQPGVQSPDWCGANPHRVLALGPVARISSGHFRFLEASWVSTRSQSAMWRYREYVFTPSGPQLLPASGGGVGEARPNPSLQRTRYARR